MQSSMIRKVISHFCNFISAQATTDDHAFVFHISVISGKAQATISDNASVFRIFVIFGGVYFFTHAFILDSENSNDCWPLKTTILCTQLQLHCNCTTDRWLMFQCNEQFAECIKIYHRVVCGHRRNDLFAKCIINFHRLQHQRCSDAQCTKCTINAMQFPSPSSSSLSPSSLPQSIPMSWIIYIYLYTIAATTDSKRK